MKIGPVDLNQLSTWRGIIGLIGISGFSFSPALNEQIALLAATLIALIEMFRDEYRPKKPTVSASSRRVGELTSSRAAPAPTPDTPINPGFDAAADGERPADRLRKLPTDDSPFPTAGFGDRWTRPYLYPALLGV